MDWYKTMKKPSWAPQASLFGKVWSILYIIIFAVNIYVIAQFISGKIGFIIWFPFLMNLATNLIFTPLQFGLKNNYLALADILMVFITIIWAMIVIWPISIIVSLAYLPYLTWVCIATALQISITWLNR